jgi:MFS superfamily sulfate permease-like transporter
VAAGAVVIPQAMAYATIAGLPVEVGLYTCMVPMVVYALIGGSRTLSVSTTSTVASLTGSTLLASSVAAGSDDPARALASLTVLVGVILLAARAFRLGTLVDNISEATLTGIKAGVGLTVAAGQLPKLLGVEGAPDADAFFGEVAGVIRDLDAANGATIVLSVATIVVMLVLARFAPAVPAPLVAVGAGIALVAVWSIDDRGVALVGAVPSGLPLPVLPDPDVFVEVLGGALAIALMCFMETASVAGAVRRRDEPPIDNNRELAANALASLLGGLFRAMPPAGGFSQTAINVRTGARSQLSSLVTVLLAVACALFLGGVLSDLPEATLGALVFVAVAGLISPSAFAHYWRVDRLSFWVAVTTAAAGLVAGLIYAVLIGVIFTLLLVLYELNQIGVSELQLDADGDLRVAGEATHPIDGLLILRVDGPLYTANVRRVREQILQQVEAQAPSVVVVDLTAVNRATVTVVDQLGELRSGVRDRGAELWISSPSSQVERTASSVPEWNDMRDGTQVFPTARAAVRAWTTRSPER